MRGRGQEVKAIPSVALIEQFSTFPLVIKVTVSAPRSLRTSLGVN